MTKALTKVIYRPDHTSNNEYTIIVNPEEYKQWKDGDTSVALSAVVDSFAVFQSNQGKHGFLGQASKQQLETDFGTSVDVDVVKTILEKGKDQPSDSIGPSNGTSTMNISRGGRGSVDLRGKGPFA